MLGGEGIGGFGIRLRWVIYRVQGVVFGLVIFIFIIWLGLAWSLYIQYLGSLR